VAWKLRLNASGALEVEDPGMPPATIDLADNTKAPVAATITPDTTFDVDNYGRIILGSIR